MMKLIYILLFAALTATAAGAADHLELAKPDHYLPKLRRDHPRLFVNADTIGELKMAAERNPVEFKRMKDYVDALPEILPDTPLAGQFTRDNQGRLTTDAGRQARTLFQYDGSLQAARAALLYTITGEPGYLARTKSYLGHFLKVLDFSAKGELFIDLIGDSRINALLAYDLIYNDLTDAERRAIMLPILRYTEAAQADGSFTFRRSMGGVADGNYGEPSLQYFVGLTLYGDGIDDQAAARLLKRGMKLFVGMMDHRDAVSAGSGLLSSATTGYAFGAYPYASFLFLHSYRAAFGENIAENWTQMLNFHRFFDGSAIRINSDGSFLTYGIGDMWHRNNTESAYLMYTHLAQAIHFYGKKHPGQAAEMYGQIARLPDQMRGFAYYTYPMLAFLATGFDPALIRTGTAVSAPYFFAPGFGLLYMRSGYGLKDTCAAFRFGASDGNHQHYDELSFVIYKHNFLALDSGSRTETDHHHNYAPQSVAHNTLLIHEPGEAMPPFWTAWSYKPDGKTYSNHGGQNSKTAAKSIALRSTPDFIYAAGDATASYASTKCREAVRQFVYLKPDLFVIYDRVESVRPEQNKVFLLHTQNRPEAAGPNTFRADHDGRLFIRTLLPERPKFELVGGPGKEFFASGRNWELEGGAEWDKTYRLTGKWRLEVSGGVPDSKSRFLHVLEAADPAVNAMVETVPLRDGDTDGVRIRERNGRVWELKFNRSGAVGLHLKLVEPDGRVKFDDSPANGIDTEIKV